MEIALNHSYLNPLEQPELSNSLSSHLNPDSNFIASLPSSSYMVEDDLNNRVPSFSDKTNFSIIHLNARSLLKNLNKLNQMLRNFKKPFSVIGVSETWLADCTAELVDITDITHGKNIIIGCVYRSPNQNTALFLEKFNNILSRISKDNKKCYVMGDFNLDLLQYNHHTPTMYYTLIYPYITYCNSSWSSTYVSNLNRITIHKSELCELSQIQTIEHILLPYFLN